MKTVIRNLGEMMKVVVAGVCYLVGAIVAVPGYIVYTVGDALASFGRKLMEGQDKKNKKQEVNVEL